ncbi:DEAD/DEAH box helicase [Pontibacillus halophilus JSM 076056 = DSM 19796]|uniref:DEAD-box ATP-dependent RNA helicase CshA n=1 Tax=Pontibacillus halophilus JSM 076056 = DSM 19796 TaxID=1385510 RepID=A0A0A5GBL9_9BACI|nr:DEAD/DEAH box helicase [Pontibacillus halophilus]KGX90566.1 DEAD/DEAH box helicase [Pontibacillus halophilus JSM 076056 = DSM 19796]
MTTFNSLGLSKPVLKAVLELGFEEATPIQEQTIPLAMDGRDVIGQAQTGTGKTAAFGIPMIEKINQDMKKVQGLVIAPTRELAMQVGTELHKYGKYKGVKILPVYGGTDMGRQIRELKAGPQVVVATPGRLLDHIRRGTIQLSNIHTTVLDEADEMLNMGFIDDIKDILKAIPMQRQTLLFSATMPKAIHDIAQNMMKKPETVKLKAKQLTVDKIDQYFVEVKDSEKFDTLTRLLDVHTPELAIVFGRTKKRVDEITDGLGARGFRAEGIHGDLSQGKRMSVLKKFKRGGVEVLVATDVAARGLDISGVTHVYNFDIPQDPESYVHRIGRTGRAGKEGYAVSFVTPRETGHLGIIEKTTQKKMTRLQMPTLDEALQGQQQIAKDKLVKAVEDENLDSYRGTADELLEQYDPATVVSAALKMLTKKRRNVPVELTSIAPISVKGPRGGKGGGRNGGRNFDRKKGNYGPKKYGDKSYRGGGDRNRSGKGGSGGSRNRKFQGNKRPSNSNNR